MKVAKLTLFCEPCVTFKSGAEINIVLRTFHFRVVCAVCVGLEFELAMSFIGVKYSSLSKKRGETLRNSIEDFTDAILCVPVNLGKYTQFGRGIAARREILGMFACVLDTEMCHPLPAKSE